MTTQQSAWTILTEAIGSYCGQGVNHEKQNFTGNLKLEYAFEKKLIQLDSSAIGSNEEIYHKEHSWVGLDVSGTLVLFVNSNNHPGTTPHIFNRLEEGADGQKTLVFRFGNIDDRNSFREEVAISIFKDRGVEHFYSWGLPGGDFQKRSGSRMKRL